MSNAPYYPGHDNELYGLVAQFENADQLVEAASKVRDAGYTATDAHVPFPVHGLSDALGVKRTVLPWIVLGGGITGCIGGFLLQYWVSVHAYALNVGGRPLNSWPSFIPVTFECTILFAGISTLIGMLALNGLPRPYHPVFNTPDFERATGNGFFLVVEASDPQFELQETRGFLDGLGPMKVSEVHG
jgi:hypothetical protein